MKPSSSLIVLFLLGLSVCLSARAQDDQELANMYKEDQAARMRPNIDWKVLSAEDSLRERKVYEMIQSGKVKTGHDHYHAAMIFQHGRDTAASAMAVKMMRKAVELDTTVNRWLLAAAIDRDLMRRGEPQIYGTQYTKSWDPGAKWVRYTIDSTKVTDEERQYYHVETLAQQWEKEWRMNLKSLYDYYASGKSADQVITLIREELKKGRKATYNVSEGSINEFGYNLMNSNKDADALKVFEVNTKLYPKGFNTWDSLGECLLKMNRKKESLKAYQKSLDLNPSNDNARRVIKEISTAN